MTIGGGKIRLIRLPKPKGSISIQTKKVHKVSQ